MDDTKIKIMSAAIKAVRQYGLEGVRIQNISELAGISPGALYRYFNGKEQLMMECFTYIDRQAAAVWSGRCENTEHQRVGGSVSGGIVPLLQR